MQASSRERRRGLCVVRREGLPMPRRRTLTSGILPSVRSMLTSLRHPWLRSSATPAPGTRATPRSVHASRSTGCQPVPVPSDVSRTACAAAVQARRREAWGEPSQGAASSVVRPRPHGRPAGFHLPCTRARGSSASGIRSAWHAAVEVHVLPAAFQAHPDPRLLAARHHRAAGGVEFLHQPHVADHGDVVSEHLHDR